MKRVLPVLVFLILTLPAPVSAGWSLVRGSGPLASFESSSRPAVAVKASPELHTVAQGKMTVLLHEGRSLSGEVPGTVWYCLSARDGAQLVVALADAGENEWYPGMMGSSTEYSRILYSCGSEKPGSVTQRVFIRPIGLDPWMGAFAADDLGWTASVMVSQYEWLDMDDGTKLLVEYREPCAAELCPVIEPGKLQSFLQRANTSFSARFAREHGIDAVSIVPYDWNGAGISSRLLSDSLGATVNTAGE